MTTPPPETPITRYMDLPRFTSMLSHGALFFASPECLGDLHEGKLGLADRQAVEGEARKTYRRKTPGQAFLLWEQNTWQSTLRTIAVSCWYSGEVESHAMWQVYGRGVAIETTVGKVLDALAKWGVEARTVMYEDYDQRPVTGPDPIEVLSYKRRGFEHEREIRFFMRLSVEQHQGMESLRTIRRDADRFVWASESGGVSVRNTGVIVPADLHTLIQRIVVSPDARIWEREAVMAVATGHDFPVDSIFGSQFEWDPYASLDSQLNPGT